MIWACLTNWKFPLLQLVAQFPRPPLGLGAQAFVIAHLLGDPVDTIRNLLRKLATCQRRAKKWENIKPLVLEAIQIEEDDARSSEESPKRVGQDTQDNGDNPVAQGDTMQNHRHEMEARTAQDLRDRLKKDCWWKALTLVTDAYDEWGEGDEAEVFL